jgi:hypothetical protein
MISAELELAAIDARHWRNWWRLLAPPGALDAPTWGLAVLDEGKLIKLVVVGKGAVAGEVYPGVVGHEAWARRLGVAALIVVEKKLVSELSAEIEGALRLDQDFVAQGLVALRAVKRHANKGLWTVPPLLDVLPAPTYEPLQRTFDLLVPDGTALVMYVIDDDHQRVHSSIIAVKERGDIVRAATHRGIADLVSEPTLARDWHTQYKRVLEAVEERYAKPSIALFVERATLIKILTGPSDQLARELNAKAVVIDPAPAWLLGLLGGAAMAAMAGRAGKALAAFLPQAARDRASAIAKSVSPWSALGFDPIELWSRIKHHYRQ